MRTGQSEIDTKGTGDDGPSVSCGVGLGDRRHRGIEATRASAALSKQVLSDFGPIWDVQATVNASVNHDDVPVDYGGSPSRRTSV